MPILLIYPGPTKTREIRAEDGPDVTARACWVVEN